MKHRKILFVILDGLGDRSILEFGGRTPLEAAKTPNFNFMAHYGLCGVQNALPKGIYPTSEECHLVLFGYDHIKDYPGRGVLEALGLNIKLNPGDIALRANFGTVDKNFNLVDPRAGNIMSSVEYSKAIGQREVDGFIFEIYSSLAHRGVLIIRGNKAGAGINSRVKMISDTDPHKAAPQYKKAGKVLCPQPLNSSKYAIWVAKALRKYQLEVFEFLNELPLNKNRIANGLLPVNFILTRGAGTFFSASGFEEKYGLKAACVAGAPLYKGIARYLGMDVLKVKGATGLANSNFKGKVAAAKKALKKYDFVYLHFKATDTAAEERGDFNEKKIIIEKIDKEVRSLKSLKNTLIFVSGDHTTACEVKDHVEDPVPFFVYNGGKNRDSIAEFGETACRFGSFKHLRGMDIFEMVLEKSGRTVKYV